MGPLTSLLMVSLAAAPPATAHAADSVHIARAAGPIEIDGDLAEAGWEGAAVMDRFYETHPGDNLEPRVRTRALLAYDDRYLYVGVFCDDPAPEQIRAPYVERDGVVGTDDNIAIFLDTRNDRRTAVELRVSPRGIQADGVFSDATQTEDFAPDFLYDTAARITEQGWQAEVRVPFSSLRYPPRPQEWGIMIWRNYPREYRYAFYSSPHPRGSNCYVCQLRPLVGLSALPDASGLLLVPYAAGESVAVPAGPGEELGPGDASGDVGLDVKWTPAASTAVDLTVNPDFSQVEADVAEIAVNERFALFYPEKRPFFLEGVELLQSPIDAVYTRTITEPRGGLRVTGKAGATAYTALATHDEGGGLVVIPGPTGSRFAPQDFASWVGITRLRRDAGRSFVSFLGTGRAIEGGGHNVVLGPDAQWRSDTDRLTAQLLWSSSQTPDRPDLEPTWDGRSLSAGAAHVDWSHDTRTIGWFARYRDVGEEFRADQGFVPQVGFRDGRLSVSYKFWPEGLLRQVQPFFVVDYATLRDGSLLDRRFVPALFLIGRRNLVAELDLVFQRQLTGDRLLSRTQLVFSAQVDPSRNLPRVGLSGFVGEDIDVENVRVGRGAQFGLSATLRPDPHVTLQVNSAVRWLDVDPGSGRHQRLFTAQVQRLKATWHFSDRAYVRLIGQYVDTVRDPELYATQVPRRSSEFSGSALFSYRLNWQTALFVGYGDERALDEEETLQPTARELFVKLAYALQR